MLRLCLPVIFSLLFYNWKNNFHKVRTTLLCAFQVHLNSAKAMFTLSNEEMKASSQSKEVIANSIFIFRNDRQQISKKGFAFAFQTVHREQALRSSERERTQKWIFVGSLENSHLSGCFRQNFGRLQGPTNCHFAWKGTQLQWSWQC